MSGHFTDRDERMWQQRAEERTARPLAIGARLRGLRVTFRGAASRAARVPRRNARGTRLFAGTPTRPSRGATGGA
ncbi:hypothetical protein [Streptomyces sp. NPDC015130]|uniref:hypothetical protein n=1 Tax=Streptomyces sp. NPDC015130 TaxID=3364940 RepID=UPI0036FC77F8